MQFSINKYVISKKLLHLTMREKEKNNSENIPKLQLHYNQYYHKDIDEFNDIKKCY